MNTNSVPVRAVGSIRSTGWRTSLLLAAVVAAPSYAVEFQSSSGEFYGSWDTTVSYGQQWRVQSRDLDIIATAHGGNGRSPNTDDGNLNYNTGLVSNTWKLTTELEFNYKNFGAFVRALGFYDSENEDEDRARTPLSSAARKRAGSNFDLLDAFVWAKFDMGNMPAEIRAGEQVLSWGESTFIQGGINIINHVNVSAIRVPGAELREALLPQDIVSFSLGTTENTSVEVFYQYDWDDIEPDPTGTYFSTNDFAVDGGEQVVLGFGAWSDQGTDWTGLGGEFIGDFNHVPRGPAGQPDDGGQYGLAFRWFLPNLIGGTEFGLFHVNYHSRLPVISGTTGSQRGVANGAGAATAVGAAAQALAAGLSFDAAVALAANTAVSTAASLGGDYDITSATAAANVGANTALAGGNVTSLATSFGVDQYANTANYFIEFPEDIKLYGASFNTEIFWGIAWQGEVSWRKDTPLQLDDVEVLFAALTPFESAVSSGAFASGGQLCGPGSLSPTRGIDQCGFPVDTRVQGWIERDTWQAQMTFTKILGPMLAADQGAFVMEGGLNYVESFPDRMTGGPNGNGIRFDGPGTAVSGNPNFTPFHFGEIEADSDFPTRSSWGYRMAGRLDYFNLIGSWTVSPRFAWQHDVNGITPGPGGSFIEGRKAATLGIRGNYQNAWELDLSYTTFWGADRHNLLTDRDFIGLNAKFSF